MPLVDDPDVLTEAEAAELLGLSMPALRQRRERATRGINPESCPPWHRTRAGGIRYLRNEVEGWQAARDELVPDPKSPQLAGTGA